MRSPELQYVADEQSNLTAVIVPIDQWNELASELETSSKQLEAIQREPVAGMGAPGF